MRAIVIHHPAKSDEVDNFRRLVERRLGEAGYTTSFLETSAEDAGRAAAGRAREEEPDLVAVFGGDGTVRVVLGEFHGSDVPVLVLPGGTGNLLVRNLGIPLDLDAALRLASTGEPRSLDLGCCCVDGGEAEPFAVMAGLGLDARMIAETDDELKRRVGWPAYVVGALKALRGRGFGAILDDGEAELRVPDARMVLVANCGTVQAGAAVIPHATPNDGRLDVLAVGPRSLRRWLSGLLYHVLGRPRDVGDDIREGEPRSVARVRVEVARAVPVQVDGDLLGHASRLDCRVSPAAVRVAVPAERGGNSTGKNVSEEVDFDH